MGLELAKAFITVRANTQKVAQDLGRLKQTATKQAAAVGASIGAAMGGSMMAALRTMAPALGVMGAGMTTVMAGGVAMTFEKAMIDVRANARLLGEEGEESFQKLVKIARELGATTQFTAVEAANALNQLVLGGLNVEETMGAIPSVLNLAASASIDLATASKIVVDNMRKYGMEAKDTGKIADFLSSAQSRAQITAMDMAAGLQSLGSAAANMNVSFQDAVAVLTGMGRAGSQMNKAGVALALMMTRLAAQPADVKRALGDLNIEMRAFVGPGGAFDLIGAMKAIATAMPEDPLEKQAVSFALFGMRGREIMGVLNLMKKGKFVEDVAKGLGEDLGRAATVASAKMDTFWGTMRRVTAALSELAITGLTPLLKLLAPILDFLAAHAKAVVTLTGLLVLYKYQLVLTNRALKIYMGLCFIAGKATWFLVSSVNALTVAFNTLMGTTFMAWLLKIVGVIIALKVAAATAGAAIVGGVFAWTIRAAAADKLAEHMEKTAEPLPTFAKHRAFQPMTPEEKAAEAAGRGPAAGGPEGFVMAPDIGRQIQEMMMKDDKQGQMVELLDASKTIQNDMLTEMRGKEKIPAVLE